METPSLEYNSEVPASRGREERDERVEEGSMVAPRGVGISRRMRFALARFLHEVGHDVRDCTGVSWRGRSMVVDGSAGATWAVRGQTCWHDEGARGE